MGKGITQYRCMTERINRETKRQIIVKLKQLKAMPLLYEIVRYKHKETIESERGMIYIHPPFYNVWEDTLIGLLGCGVELDYFFKHETQKDNYIMCCLNEWKKYFERKKDR